jgi:hypothetical protein
MPKIKLTTHAKGSAGRNLSETTFLGRLIDLGTLMRKSNLAGLLRLAAVQCTKLTAKRTLPRRSVAYKSADYRKPAKYPEGHLRTISRSLNCWRPMLGQPSELEYPFCGGLILHVGG